LPCQRGNVTFELSLWGVVLLLLALELFWDQDFRGFFSACKAYYPIFVFILFAALSLLWSVLPKITLYKVFVLFATTLMAIYLGYKMSSVRLLRVLVVSLSVICIANLAAVLLFPQASKWAGDTIWNGIFWHKIYLGAIMALTIVVFLLQLLNWMKLDLLSKIISPIMLLVALILLINAHSVAAFFTTALLAIICLLIAVWIRWGKHFKLVHYYIISGVAILANGLILANLDVLFGLFGRNTSLSGRIPMWTYLFQHVIFKRPILGYGYDAIWNLQGLRNQMTLDMNFSLQVTQSDNGFMEIWLHLGSVGLALLVGLLMIGLVRSVRYLLQERTLPSALPLVILVYAVLANISVSMLLESDCFVWALAIASQVAITTQSKNSLGRLNKANPEKGYPILDSPK
jgi:O-antigen ligase